MTRHPSSPATRNGRSNSIRWRNSYGNSMIQGVQVTTTFCKVVVHCAQRPANGLLQRNHQIGAGAPQNPIHRPHRPDRLRATMAPIPMLTARPARSDVGKKRRMEFMGGLSIVGGCSRWDYRQTGTEKASAPPLQRRAPSIRTSSSTRPRTSVSAPHGGSARAARPIARPARRLTIHAPAQWHARR